MKNIFKKCLSIILYVFAVFSVLCIIIANFTIPAFVIYGLMALLFFWLGKKLWPRHIAKKFNSTLTNEVGKDIPHFSYDPGEKLNIPPKNPINQISVKITNSDDVEGVYFAPFLEQIISEKEDEPKVKKTIDIEVNGQYLYITKAGFNKALSDLKKQINPILKEAKALDRKAEKAFEKLKLESQLLMDIKEMKKRLAKVDREFFALVCATFEDKDFNSAADKLSDFHDKIDDIIYSLDSTLEEWEDYKEDIALDNSDEVK